MADDIHYDVAVNVSKGQDGYGIYFNSGGGIIRVTKLDKKSEAEIAGVQVGDQLVCVQELDKNNKAVGNKVPVNLENYQAVLNLVRDMKYCRMEFLAPAF